MKVRLSVLFTVIIVALCSCEKDETNLTALANTNELSGQISNYSSSKIDTIYAYDYSAFGARAKVTSVGKFSMVLPIPVKVRKIGTMKGLSVSDTTALIGDLDLRVFKSGRNTGYLQRCNFMSDSVEYAGMVNSMFMYSDRPFTVKGTQRSEYSDYGKEYISTYEYNLTFKKGWNELVSRIDSYTQSSDTIVLKMLGTNNIPSDIKWVFFDESSYYTVKASTKTKMSIKPKGFLFQ